jgi:hypothetical protein
LVAGVPFDLIGQAKIGISSLELSRHLGVNYDTAWLLPNKILRAMTELVSRALGYFRLRLPLGSGCRRLLPGALVWQWCWWLPSRRPKKAGFLR